MKMSQVFDQEHRCSNSECGSVFRTNSQSGYQPTKCPHCHAPLVGHEPETTEPKPQQTTAATKTEPAATKKQLAYLADLGYPQYGRKISKREASIMIEAILSGNAGSLGLFASDGVTLTN